MECPEAASKAQHLFFDFMARIVKFDELATAGSKLIAGFRGELESLRRPPLVKTSEVVERIIEANGTERMKRYIEAGCRTVDTAVQNINKLKLLLHELEYLTVDVADILTSINETSHSSLHRSICFDKDEAELYHCQCLQISEYSVMMRIVLNMYERDYKMQEKVVESLNYNSSSGELDSYCLMWDLRPYVNEQILHQAWRFIPENYRQSPNT